MAGIVTGEDDQGNTPDVEDVNLTADTSTADTVSDVTPADPSAAEPGPKSMLDAVNTALAGKEKSPPSVLGSEAEVKPKADADKDAGEFTPEEWKHLPQKTQKSIERFRSQISGFKQQVGDLQPKADGFERITGFMHRSNLKPADVDKTFEIAAAIVNDPAKAYEMLVPIVTELHRLVGNELPPDLQKEVDEGFITEARARELSQQRAKLSLTEQRQQAESTRTQSQQQETALRTHVHTVATSATDWERAKAKADPDWNLKKDRVAELVELDLVRRQRKEPGWFPKNAQEAITMSEDALKRVNEELKRFGPAKRAMAPVTGSASQSSRPKPKNMLDVVNNALAG